MPDLPQQPRPSPSLDQSSGRPPIVALVRDLMFSGRIGATARAMKAPLKLLRDPASLAGVEGRLLIVDLNQSGALEAAVAWKAASSGAVVGFVSHVDAETIARAGAAGIDCIMPRSQFVNRLPELLSS